MKNHKCTVLISILNWNTSASTLACVASLVAQVQNESIEATILVLDNGSSELDFQFLKDHLPRGVKLQSNRRNLGFAGGHNVAMRIAIHDNIDFIWLCNSDAVATDCNTLNRLVDVMQTNPTCGAVSPMLANEDGTVYFSGGNHDWRTQESTWTPLAQSKVLQEAMPNSRWVSGAAVLFRVNALRQVGLLNELYFAYYEDNEICARLAASGWLSRVAFDVTVQHPIPRSDTERAPYYFYLMQRNALLFWMENTPREFRRRLRLRLLDRAFFACNRLYAGGFTVQSSAGIQGIADFLKGRSGSPAVCTRPSTVMSLLQKLTYLIHRRAIVRMTSAEKAH